MTSIEPGYQTVDQESAFAESSAPQQMPMQMAGNPMGGFGMQGSGSQIIQYNAHNLNVFQGGSQNPVIMTGQMAPYMQQHMMQF